MKSVRIIFPVLACMALCLFIFGCGSVTGGGGGGGGGGVSPWIYCGASDDNAVSIINGSTNTLAGTIELAPRKPYHMAASPCGKYLYVSTNSLEVVEIDTGTNTISRLITIDAVTKSYGMAVSGNGAYLYLTRNDDSKLVRIDLNSDPVTWETVGTIGTPKGIILAHDDTKSIVCEGVTLEFFSNISFSHSSDIENPGCGLYSVTMKDGWAFVPRFNAAGDVLMVDATTEGTMGLLTPESSTFTYGIVSIPGKNKLYVSRANTSPGVINIIDTSPAPTFESTVITGETVTTMPYPTYMTATTDGKYVYVYDPLILHDQLCVIDTDTDKVLKAIPINTGQMYDNNPVIIYK